jgi:hypothetical protein
VFAITSEPQTLATEAEADWAFGFPCIGDPHHEIRDELKDKGWLDLFYNEDYGHLYEREWAKHPKGYYQPGVLALNREGRVLYRWRCVPKYSNQSGAGGRPEARYTWDQIRAAKDATEDAELDTTPAMGSQTISWPRFLMILFAHGWFVRAKAFPLERPGDNPSVSPRKMMRRVYGFVAIWIMIFGILPIGWSTAAAALWVAIMTPGLIEIHRQFQNEPDTF